MNILGKVKQFAMTSIGIVVAIALLSIVGLIGFRAFFVDFADNYTLAYKYDLRTGKIDVLWTTVYNPITKQAQKVPRTGYIVTPPFVVEVHTVDLRPMQVCISANNRVLNCKLVEFVPEGLELFLSWHGRNDYNGTQTGSEPSAFNKILMSYAYDGSGKTYPFLRILRELKPEEITQNQPEVKPQ